MRGGGGVREERGGGGGDSVRGQHPGRGPHDVFGKATRILHTERPQRRAALVVSTHARGALPARRERMEDDQVPLGDPRVVGVDALDDPRDLVSGPDGV